jgi:polyhydroxyalkanoate synthesis repressor PhaR
VGSNARSPMSARSIIIKKYENRRLYDTSNSRYVNLEDIAQMVREGTEVRVIDATTGEDLTRLVLTQIIVESAKAPDSAFPLDMLRQMIMASGAFNQEGLRAYMKAMFDMYQNTYSAFGPGLSLFDFVQQPKPESTAGRSAAASPSEGSAPPPADHNASLDDLRQRIEDLERLIAKGTGARPAAKGKRSSRPKG